MPGMQGISISALLQSFPLDFDDKHHILAMGIPLLHLCEIGKHDHHFQETGSASREV